MEQELVGRYCMVRTRTAGVFAGTIKALENQKAMLTGARRMWYWDGAATLSQLATYGTSKPENCKFPCPVAEIYLPDTIEIIPITDKAKASIQGVPIWKK